MEKIVQLLKDLQFTESEAKVYSCLLEKGCCSGYEVSKLSGVPRSKIYTILDQLERKGYVATTRETDTKLYSAIEVEELSTSLRESMDDKLNQLEKLSKVNHSIENTHIWNIANYSTILGKCEHIVSNAKEKVLIQIWMEDLTDQFTEVINNKYRETEKVLTILYDSNEKYDTKLKKYYKHGFSKDKLKDVGSRWITIIADDKEMLYATIIDQENANAIFTNDTSLVFFANEYVTHDAYCLRLIHYCQEEVKEKFGDDMEGIRDIF